MPTASKPRARASRLIASARDMVSRMLKKSASFVLASFRSSTYPRGYDSALHSLRPCWTNFLSILQGVLPLF